LVVALFERAQRSLVVLDDEVAPCIPKSEGRFASRIAETTITAQAILRYSPRHWNLTVDVIEDPDFLLCLMEMEPARVLNQRSPRDRQR
jgi:hypothetical protein